MVTAIDVYFCVRYREIEESNKLVQWFWQVLESFSNEERVLFMRFVSGRSRLPANPADITQRFQIMKVDRVSVSFLVNLNHSLLCALNKVHCFLSLECRRSTDVTNVFLPTPTSALLEQSHDGRAASLRHPELSLH